MTDINKRILKEFLRRLISERADKLSSYIEAQYDKFIYSEKTRYTQSKEYWKKVRQGEPKDEDFGLQSELDKLDTWVPKYGARSKGDPHITYNHNQYDNRREENPLIWSTAGNTDPIGYEASLTKDEYYKQRLEEIATENSPDPLGSLVCQYLSCKNNFFESQLFLKFYSFCEQNEVSNFNNYLDGIDKYLETIDKHPYTGKVTVVRPNKNRINIAFGYYITPTKIEHSGLLPGLHPFSQVKEDAIVEVEIIETRKTSTFIVITNVYPHLKQIIGLKKGDTFTLPSINYTYLIKNIHD